MALSKKEVQTNFSQPKFWKDRLDRLKNPLDALQEGGVNWELVAEKQKEIFKKYISGKVLDAGCGIGRTIPLMPEGVDYTGIDISPDFIKIAKKEYLTHKLMVGDARKTKFKDKEFDWAILSGMGGYPENPPSDFWNQVSGEMRRVSSHLIVLWLSKPTEYMIIEGNHVIGKNIFKKHEEIKRRK